MVVPTLTLILTLTLTAHMSDADEISRSDAVNRVTGVDVPVE